jgi:hypothetical protein
MYPDPDPQHRKNPVNLGHFIGIVSLVEYPGYFLSGFVNRTVLFVKFSQLWLTFSEEIKNILSLISLTISSEPSSGSSGFQIAACDFKNFFQSRL